LINPLKNKSKKKKAAKQKKKEKQPLNLKKKRKNKRHHLGQSRKPCPHATNMFFANNVKHVSLILIKLVVFLCDSIFFFFFMNDINACLRLLSFLYDPQSDLKICVL